MFPIEDLRQAVETAKRILTKEKVDKQLTGQSSISPFMSIRGGTERKVSFNTTDELWDKIDKKDRNRGNDKHRYNRTRDRARRTMKQNR